MLSEGDEDVNAIRLAASHSEGIAKVIRIERKLEAAFRETISSLAKAAGMEEDVLLNHQAFRDLMSGLEELFATGV